MQQCSVMQQ